jgi:uncharacterized protein YegP (UPF0339 family)
VSAIDEPRFEVFPEKVGFSAHPTRYSDDLTGQFTWHFKDANAHITFTGGESFTRREDAHRSIRDVAADVLINVFGEPPVVAAARIVLREHRGLLPIIDLDENGNEVASR